MGQLGGRQVGGHRRAYSLLFGLVLRSMPTALGGNNDRFPGEGLLTELRPPFKSRAHLSGVLVKGFGWGVFFRRERLDFSSFQK
jgi:hypothetical protein